MVVTMVMGVVTMVMGYKTGFTAGQQGLQFWMVAHFSRE